MGLLAMQALPYLPQPVLGIETSCDETSVGVVLQNRVLANIVSSQARLHEKWGGIVPEAAARKHAEAFLPVLEQALHQANVTLEDLGGIGVTNRPGLVGALAVGIAGAKALSLSRNIPLLGVHHLEAHLLSSLLYVDEKPEPIPFPHVCLLVSGGHTELILIKNPGEYKTLGGTIDDAAGEAFDKSARALGLGYPGGPAIQKAAQTGIPHKYHLPRGLEDPTLNFSFSGLKTAVIRLVEREGDALDVPSAAWAVEEAITSVLSERSIYACTLTGCQTLSLVGGVAANRRLRAKISDLATRHHIQVWAPALEFCTDNGAMIAHVASWRLACGERDGLDLDAWARAPLPPSRSQQQDLFQNNTEQRRES
jgi:N6-L-threonylcarbamoyladenine synthase